LDLAREEEKEEEEKKSKSKRTNHFQLPRGATDPNLIPN